MRSYPAVVKSPQSSVEDEFCGADIGFKSGPSELKLSDPRSNRSFVTDVDDAPLLGFVGRLDVLLAAGGGNFTPPGGGGKSPGVPLKPAELDLGRGLPDFF